MAPKKNGYPVKTIQIIAPVLIGLAVVVWMFAKEYDPRTWSLIEFTPHLISCIALAWVFMAGRDFGLTWRFRIITDRQLSWRQAIRVNFLCEFTSAITPSAVGGSVLGMLFMHTEGIAMGRATTLMMTTLFLDELFFVITCPLIVALIPYRELFDFSPHTIFASGISVTFWIVYGVIALWTLILFVGIFVKPQGVSRALYWLSGLRLMRRWQSRISSLGQNMVATSVDLRHRNARWWVRAFCATALSWMSRYLVVNALFLGFAPYANQLVVFGRQFVVWVVLMVCPTPGGSGVSEWLFTEYYGDLLREGGKSVALIIALFWRIISYYIYLIIGVCILPGWLKRSMAMRANRHKTKDLHPNKQTES
ncbi:MAG: flippase-like domain-containing protein [Pseudoflavonifractor sp.]|nr:flippase-like domain-containing protein [Pseudoflavonifractor sp.]